MNWLGKRRGSCGWFREALRSLVEETPAAVGSEELLKDAHAELREHVSACPACGSLLSDALEARKLLREAFAPAVAPDTFAARVMAEIRGREAQQAIGAYPWAAMQALASRVAWVSALVLLVGSAWVYQRRAPRPNPAAPPETAADRFPEPAPQPSNLDEVLMSLAEAKP
jgi:hypothetical protein